jgi:hypothetical protein
VSNQLGPQSNKLGKPKQMHNSPKVLVSAFLVSAPLSGEHLSSMKVVMADTVTIAVDIDMADTATTIDDQFSNPLGTRLGDFSFPVVDFQLTKMFTFLHVNNYIINKLKIHYRVYLYESIIFTF